MIKQILLIVSILAVGGLLLLLGLNPIQAPRNSASEASPPAEQTEEQASQPSASAGHALAGIWSGALATGGTGLRIVVEVDETSTGGLVANLDSIDQGAFDLPIDAISLDGDRVTFTMSDLGASYEGILSEDGQEIRGTWSQAGAELPLTLARVDEAPAIDLTRPQDPVEPLPYEVEGVTFENEATGITLAGTLSLPRSGGPFPAVVLISGSGPQNRNEELLNHRPFLVIADHLTRQGIAVLRYDDRGVGESGGQFQGSTSLDFADDAEAAFRFLQGRGEIDGRNIGLVGHSEGGLIAPLVAARNGDVAFIVLLAGPGIPGDEIILKQSALIARAEGMRSEEFLSKSLALSERVFEVVKSQPDDALASQEVRRLLDEYAATLSEQERAAQGFSDEGIAVQLAQLLSPWFRFFLSHDPAPTLTQVRCPVLALNGELDLQVPAGENLLAVTAALEAGGNGDYAVVKLPKLNHLFQRSTTGAPSEYAVIEETFAPMALNVLTTWILSHTQDQ